MATVSGQSARELHAPSDRCDLDIGAQLASLRVRRALATVIVGLAVGWTGYRFGALRASANDILAEAQRLQSKQAGLQGVIDAYEAGFLRRPAQVFRSHFVNGSESVSDTTNLGLAWEEPIDGVYLVADWNCPWSQETVGVALEVADRGGREAILLDPVPGSGPKWRAKFNLAATGLRVIAPADGWWSIGVPDGITPVWFAVASGRFVAIGVGAEGLKTLALDRAAPNSTDFSVYSQEPEPEKGT